MRHLTYIFIKKQENFPPFSPLRFVTGYPVSEFCPQAVQVGIVHHTILVLIGSLFDVYFFHSPAEVDREGLQLGLREILTRTFQDIEGNVQILLRIGQ